MSHLWDMTAHYRGRHTNLHGAQVGVATLMTSTLYQGLMSLEVSSSLVDERLRSYKPFDAYARLFASLPEPLRPAVEKEARKKYPSDKEALGKELEAIRHKWGMLRSHLEAFLQDPAAIRSTLEAVGAPTTARELGISDEEVREAFFLARDIRARYTVLDLGWQLGALERFGGQVLRAGGVGEG
jgi:glycerol-1-phosphate dehydrogenase [NAD(P)+]